MIARLQAWIATSALALSLGVALGAGALALWERHAPFGWGLGQKLEKAVAAKAKVEADLNLCRANVNVLDLALKGQNASIATLKKEADAAKARASRAVEAAQRRSEVARRDAAEIMGRRPSGDLCASALELLREP